MQRSTEKAGATEAMEPNQRKKAGARYGRQERGNDFGVLFQGHLKKIIGRILGVRG